MSMSNRSQEVSFSNTAYDPKPSVLLIEDHSGTRETCALLLRSNGFRVATAADARSGLVRARNEHFDVIVTDIGLPDMSGVEVLRCLEVEGNSAIKLATTAFPTDEGRAEAMAAGAVEVCEGLLLADALGEILNRLVDERGASTAKQGSGWAQVPQGSSSGAVATEVLDARVATSVKSAAAGASRSRL